MLTIENDVLKVVIDQKGAQLTHVLNKKDGFDYIWNGKEWAKHAPILFPAIGRSTDDHYLFGGKEYPMPQHGFASAYEFEVCDHQKEELKLQFKQNDETRESYPFDFTLTITFTLKQNQLDVRFEVDNPNEQELSFALGFHPAFNVPINGEGTFEDYEVDFDTKAEQLHQFEIIKTPAPYRDGKVIPSAAKGRKLPLTHQVFEKGLIIFTEKIDAVTLQSPKAAHSVHLDTEDFPYVCLWTKEGADLPYLCIEPFYGLPDIAGQKQELSKKEGNCHLAPEKIKVLTCAINFA